MTNTQIKYFLTVANELSFSRAARSLYVSQPAVSKQISTLEAELGFLLFDRTEKNIKLTTEGKMLRTFLLNAQREYEETIAEMKNKSNVHSGSVKIGCIETWNTKFFYDKIYQYFATAHPNISLSVEDYSILELMTALRSGEIDVGFTYKFAILNQKDIFSKPFVTLNAGIICNAAGYAGESTVADFQDRPFLVGAGNGEIMERVISEVCVSNGFAPRFKHCKRLSAEVTELLSGSGIMMSEEWCYLRDNSSFKYVPVNYKMPTRIVYLPNSLNTAKNIFVNEVAYLFERTIA
ncbi:MAG: LysR family transcriptional regulator [Oscillospiraceae bacterium]|nr:LysR family transcriptional regulator [Oscillospiraceae bacterium]